MPTSNEWNTIKLKYDNRKILTENNSSKTTGGTLPSSFSYQNYVSRLLTTKELSKACNITIGSIVTGKLDNCNYLLEETRYSKTSSSLGYWLETPLSSTKNAAFGIIGTDRSDTTSVKTSATGNFGVRPVIEVPIDNIDY